MKGAEVVAPDVEGPVVVDEPCTAALGELAAESEILAKFGLGNVSHGEVAVFYPRFSSRADTPRKSPYALTADWTAAPSARVSGRKSSALTTTAFAARCRAHVPTIRPPITMRWVRAFPMAESRAPSCVLPIALRSL